MFKSFNISNMWCNIEVKHPIELSYLQAKVKDERSESRSSSTSDSIGEVITLDNKPFTIVIHTGFTRLMKLVEPCHRLLLPDKCFRKYQLQKLLIDGVLKVQFALSLVSRVSLTIDIWSSVAQY